MGPGTTPGTHPETLRPTQKRTPPKRGSDSSKSRISGGLIGESPALAQRAESAGGSRAEGTERAIRDDPLAERLWSLGSFWKSKCRGNVSIRELPDWNYRVPFSFYDHDNEAEERSCCKGHQQIKKMVSDI